jgi:nucleotide-binding universal stress UspA family protein
MQDTSVSPIDTLTTGPWYSPPDPVGSGPILAATDGTATGDDGFRAACTIAHKVSAAIDVLLVAEPLPVIVPSPVRLMQPLVVTPELLAEMRESIIERTRALAPKELDWKVAVVYGRAGKEIAAHAANSDAQMIVLSLVHHGIIDRILDGETALEVVRQSTVPILLASPGMNALPKHAVVAVDFSAESMEAAREAVRLLDDAATVTFAYVVPSLMVFSRSGLSEDECQAVMLRELGDFVASLCLPASITAEQIILRGRPANELLKLAERINADLIAVGTRGADLMQRLFVGSNTVRIVHNARCSVLVAPQREVATTMNTRTHSG